MEVNKLLLMLNEVKTTSHVHLESDYKGLFHTITITTTNTYRDIVSKELVGF
jgi:hypothetical protein